MSGGRWRCLTHCRSSQQPASAGSSAGFSIVSVTALNLREIELIAAGRTLAVDMDSSLTGSDRLAVTRFDAKSETSDLGATGRIQQLE